MILLSILTALAQDGVAAQGGVATPWMDEGSVLIQGLADRPLIGGGVVRQVSGTTWVGGRAFIPVWGRDLGEADLFVRAHFTPRRTASLFVEGEVAAWIGRDVVVPAVGGSFGVRVRVHPRLSVGGSFGPTVVPRGLLPDPTRPLVDAGPVGLAPRMRATVDFLL